MVCDIYDMGVGMEVYRIYWLQDEINRILEYQNKYDVNRRDEIQRLRDLKDKKIIERYKKRKNRIIENEV